MRYQDAVSRVLADPRYQKNIEYGVPRPGHPEGEIKCHIEQLRRNLKRLKPRLATEEDSWKQEFLIHVHDTFKAEASPEASICTDPLSHETLARLYATEFIEDGDLLNIIQHHDENYHLWKQRTPTGDYDRDYLKFLLTKISDWDLFLAFTIVDGFTLGKDYKKLSWFINEVRALRKETRVDETWIPPESEMGQ